MKIFIYILAIISVLFVSFLLVGLFSSDLTYDYEIVANKPLTETWSVLNDEDKLSEWLPGFQKIEHISGEAGTVGSVSNVYFIENGEQMIVKETITDIIPEESISMTYESEFMTMEYRMSIADLGEKTKIKTNTTVRGNGIMFSSIIAFIGNTIKEQEEENLSKLKKTIENNKKVYLQKEEID